MKRIVIESGFAPTMRELMEGVALYVKESRASWQLFDVSPEEFPLAVKGRPDGFLTMFSRVHEKSIAMAKRSGIPTVNMLRNIFPEIPSVASDHIAVGEAAAEYYLGRGFKHFAFVGTNRDWSEGRHRGFVERLGKERQGATVKSHTSLDNLMFRQVGNTRVTTSLKKWIRLLTYPVAILAGADYISRAVLDACDAARVSVPEEVSILGVDNNSVICNLATVPLSSIPQNFMRMGFEAARMLDGIMTKRRRPRGPVWIRPREIVVRRSTDFVAAGDPDVAAALRMIHAAGKEIPSVKAILEQVAVSRQWLDLRFKDATGRTLSEEIRRVKLSLAEQLVMETSLSIYEIARRCGFSHAENLTRFLTEQTGFSPRKLREQNRRDN